MTDSARYALTPDEMRNFLDGVDGGDRYAYDRIRKRLQRKWKGEPRPTLQIADGGEGEGRYLVVYEEFVAPFEDRKPQVLTGQHGGYDGEPEPPGREF